jgi:hypothetical protein
MTKKEIANLRNIKWRTRRDLRITAEKDALDFIDDVGFCFAFASSGIIAGTCQFLAEATEDTFGNNLLPSLWEAVCGVPGGIPAIHPHHDPYIGPVWGYKDALPLKRKVFYGKVLKQKPTFISLRMLPYFYALFGSPTPEEDYLEEYQRGALSQEAKDIFECLLRSGSLPNTLLRGELGMLDKARKYCFQRAITELQSTLRIVKVDVSDEGTIWNLFSRWMPEVIKAASRIKRKEGMKNIVLTYISDLVISTPKMMNRLFGWDAKEVEEIVQLLAQEDKVQLGVRIEGLQGNWIAKVV